MQTATFVQRGPRTSSWLPSLAQLTCSKHRPTNHFEKLKLSSVAYTALCNSLSIAHFCFNFHLLCYCSSIVVVIWKGSAVIHFNKAMLPTEALMICFDCSNMLLGKTCLSHHASTCCKLPVSIRKWYRPMMEHGNLRGRAQSSNVASLRWIDCNMCDLQRQLPSPDNKAVTCTSRWIRFTVKLFFRRLFLGKMKMLTTIPPWPVEIQQALIDLLA